MAPLTYRACCDSPTAQGIYYLDATVPEKGSGPDIPSTIAEYAPSFETAMHEAGHAAICHLLGVRIVRAQLGARSFVERDISDANDMTNPEMVMLVQAGDIAERWAKYQIYRPQGDEYAESIERVKSTCHGKCDACLAAVFAMAEVDDGHDATAVNMMRSIELQTIDILTGRAETLAIKALANRLMLDGKLDGDTCHEVLAEHLTFGAFRAAPYREPRQ